MKTLYTYLLIGLFSLTIFSCKEEIVDQVQTGSIKGKVVTRGTNTPLKNVKITTSPSTNTVFTAADGSFEITEVPMGDYSVKAEVSGYLNNFQSANLKNSGQVVTLAFEMDDDESLNTAPSIPELLSPSDNAENQPLTVQLSWKSTDPDSLDVLNYRLIVKNNFNTNVLEVKDLEVTTYTLENLVYGASYFWQVVVNDGIHNDVYSPVYKFTTNKVPQNRYHFVRKQNGNSYIVSSDEAGTSFNLTSNSFNSWRPRKNNNAGLIAFLRTEGGNSHIFTAKPDGTEVFKVTGIPVAGFNNTELDFAWSTNGEKFIYPNFNKLYKINKDGSGQELLYTTTDGSLISECDWSYDGSKIALKTNDLRGYNSKIIVIDMLGNILKTVLSDANGASGGLNFSVDGNYLVYCHDVSGYQDDHYRQLDSHIFLYNLTTNTARDLSVESEKENGTNDLDPRLSPNNSQIIFTNTSNDGISVKNIMVISISSDTESERASLFSNGEMPDWE